ncbi:MAG: LEPR-XLL domain-containing protein [Phycisphaeraceae bacterium]|nr:LEPR-XLL domain-containing protein [Phycisphaeraceae bacterium]
MRPPRALPTPLWTLLCVLLAAASASRDDAAVSYLLDNLGTLGAWANDSAAINDYGRFVGTLQDAQFTPYAYRSEDFALGALPSLSVSDLIGSFGGNWGQAAAVNASGQTVGTAGYPFGQSHAFRVPADRALLSTDDLGALGGSNSIGLGLNDLGQAVGAAETASGSFLAFRTQPNQPINPATDNLGALGGEWSQAYAINNAGQTVGAAANPAGLSRAFSTSPNAAITPQDAIPLLPGMTQNAAYAVSQDGLIAGSAWNDQGQYHAFRATRSGNLWNVLDLGALGGAVSEALGVNDLGAVVGYATGADGQARAFVSYNDSIIDLNLLIDPLSGWTLTRAVDINNQGQIIGQGTYLGQPRAFLLTPLLTLGDFNGDSLTNVQDINPFVLALRDLNAYKASYPDVILARIDPNSDGAINVQDINPFIELLTSPSAAVLNSLPEPGAMPWLLGAGLLSSLRRRRRPDDSNPPPTLEPLEPRWLLSADAPAIIATPLDLTPGPRVTGLWVSGSHWSSSFLNAVAPGTPGYAPTVGSDLQLLAVPWLGVDRVTIRFDQAVLVDAQDLELRGVNQPDLLVTSFSYDPATFTATWTLASTLDADLVVIELNGQGDDPITTLDGRWLDGEWSNPLDAQTPSTFPSGDGAQGGNFQFLLAVLPGDVNRNSVVAGDDLLTLPIGVTTAGSPRYLPAADINADGQIRADDLALARARLGNSVPDALPLFGPTQNHQVLFDNGATGDLTVDFDRDSSSVDASGLPVAQDQIRYDDDRALTDLADFQLVQQTNGTLFPMASGVDLDGQTPLTVYADSNYALKIILGSIDPLPDLTVSTLNSSHTHLTADLMRPGRPGPGDPNLAYTPKAFVVLHGTLLAMCVRLAWDPALAKWTTNGTALLYSLNHGQLWNIAGQYDFVPGQDGRDAGNIWCFNTYYPDTDSTDAPLEVWLPYTDYNANSGSPGGQLFLAKAHRASVDPHNNNWVIDPPVKLLQELQANMHFHAAGVIPGANSLRLFLAKGDNLGRQEVVELYCPDKSLWTDTNLWQVFHAVNGQTSSPQAYGNQFVSPVPGPVFGTLLVANDVSNQEISLLRPGANPGDPVVFESVFGQQASTDYSLGSGHERKYEGLWLTLPKPETRSNYVGNSALHNIANARRILYSPDGYNFAYLGAYLRGAGPTTIISIHGDKILLPPSLNDPYYLRALDLPTLQHILQPALVAPGASNALAPTPWQVVSQPAPANLLIPLLKNPQGLWLDPDSGLPLDHQPPSLGPVFLLVLNNPSSGNLGSYRWLGNQTVGYEQILSARVHYMALGSRLPRVVLSTLAGQLTLAANPIDTDDWATATLTGHGSNTDSILSISSAVTPGVRMLLAFDTVQIDSAPSSDGHAYPIAPGLSAPDERLAVTNLALTDQPWSVQTSLLLPPGYYDSQSAFTHPSSPLLTLYQDDQHYAELWADYASNAVTVRLVSDDYDITLHPTRTVNLNYANLQIDTSGPQWKIHSPTNELSSYRWSPGDQVYVAGGAGCRPGWYEITDLSGYDLLLENSPGLVPCNNPSVSAVTSGYTDFRIHDQVQITFSRRNPQTFIADINVAGWHTTAVLDHLAARDFTPTQVRFANADYSRIASVAVASVASTARDYFGPQPFTNPPAPLTLTSTSLTAATTYPASAHTLATDPSTLLCSLLALTLDPLPHLSSDSPTLILPASLVPSSSPDLPALVPLDDFNADLPTRPINASLADAWAPDARTDPAADSDVAVDQPLLSIFDLLPAQTF